MTNLPIILYADDDADDQFLFKEAAHLIYRERQCIIEFADNGEQALAKLQASLAPDIVFLDMNMPLKDGLCCLKEIRADKRFQHLPVTILSTSRNDADIVAAYENGADCYAVKPMTLQELGRIILHCMERFVTGRNAMQFAGQAKSYEHFLIR